MVNQSSTKWTSFCESPLAFHNDTTRMYYPIPGQSIPPTHLSAILYSSMATTSSNCVVSPYPFTLKRLTPQIQICHGCRIPFHPNNDQPPYDLVVCQKKCCPYKIHNGQMKTPSTPSNCHYHVNLNCIRAAAPHFCQMS